jgi:F-box-like
MALDHDSLRARSTAYHPLTADENVESFGQGGRVRIHNAISYFTATRPNPFSPPTPAPTPQPLMPESGPSSSGSSAATTVFTTSHDVAAEALAWSSLASTHLCNLPSSAIDSLLVSTLPHLTPAQLVHLASILPARHKRDFIADLPQEIALHILSFVADVETLARAGRVSRIWRLLVYDDAPWKTMCVRRGFDVDELEIPRLAKVRPRRRRTTTSPARPGPLASVRNLWAASSQEDSSLESAYMCGTVCCVC